LGEMRRSRITFIKVLCVLLLLALVVVHTVLRGGGDDGSAAEEGSQEGIDALMKELDAHTPRKDGEETLGVEKNSGAEESLAGERMHGLPNVSQEELREEQHDISIGDILKNIYEANYNQVLRNEDQFGQITNSTIVIVIQVHNRLVYLRQLIESLRIARDIENTLLVFSHDVWDASINRLVRSIKFARLVQIFYPFSLQTHPHSFPGESPKDCPRDAKPDRAKVLEEYQVCPTCADLLPFLITDPPTLFPRRVTKRLSQRRQARQGESAWLHERSLARYPRPLQRSQIHTDQTPLVVENEPGLPSS